MSPKTQNPWLKVDRIQILQGKLTLRLESGVVLELLGPADGIFEPPTRLRLTKGRLNAEVGKQGRGFTVVTAAGEVNPCWRSLPGESFPAELQGAELIRPFQADRHALDLMVTVVLSQPGSVYVMHDVGKPPPGWLTEGFVDTGVRLRSGPWRPNGKVVQDIRPGETGWCFLQNSVWRKMVPIAGPVELGPPHLRGRGGPSAM